MTNYKKSYSILGVFQDDDWETVRSAYKRLILRWHPDRFQDLDQRKIAEAKCKEINLAYQILDEYYRQAGALPPEDPIVHEVLSPASDREPEHAHPPAPESAVIDPAQNSFVNARAPARRSYTTILFLIIAIAVGYVFLEPLLTDHPNISEMTVPGFTEPELVASGLAALPSPGNHDNAQEAHGVWGQNEGDSAHEPVPLTTSSHLPYITRGSTKQDVLAIQGHPLRKTDTAWDYGLSRINFQNGKVTDWYENPMNPLIVQR